MVQRKLLVWAINAYPAPYTLQGCINDAHDYATTLSSKGFDQQCILLDSMATKSAVLDGLQWLVSNNVAGDVISFAWSTHGTKVIDTSGDEPDGFDEGIVCYFTDPNQITQSVITDDEIRAKLSQVPEGVTIECFGDSCYSGTATRLANLDIDKFTSRCIPGPLTRGKKASKVLTIVPGVKECAWEACTDTQTSTEGIVTINGERVYRGLFSYFMCKAIRSYANTKTRNEIQSIVDNVVRRVIPTQTPVLECSQSESIQKMFM